MIAAIAILYEDARGQAKGFPLHTLVCACIADGIGCGVEVVEPLLRPVPKNGDSKLLAACREEAPDMREKSIFALFDADKLYRLLKQPGNTALPALHGLLRSEVSDPRTQVFLLERNTETLVEAAADCLGRPRPTTKNQLDRDTLLASAARDFSRSSRDCIREKVPSFATFVDALVPRVQSAMPA
jgi:hypothetical protein